MMWRSTFAFVACMVLLLMFSAVSGQVPRAWAVSLARLARRLGHCSRVVHDFDGCADAGSDPCASAQNVGGPRERRAPSSSPFDGSRPRQPEPLVFGLLLLRLLRQAPSM
jgi:hypothetical protein